MLLRFAPVLFVLIWSTGWITARAAAPLADPLTFLAARFVLAALLLVVIILAFKVALPTSGKAWLHGIVSGILMHAIYLSGVWVPIDQGLATPIVGIIAAIQPLLTAVLAVAWLSEVLTRKQWLGLALGFMGLAIALLPKLFALTGNDVSSSAWLMGFCVLSIVSATLGALYQKRFLPSGDLRAITLVQYIGATLVILPAALLFEDLRIEVSWRSAAIMAWSVFGLSFAAIGLYLLLIRHGAVSRAATLIYLIPPLVALQAWMFFGEALTPLSIGGMMITVFGVYLVNQKSKPVYRQ